MDLMDTSGSLDKSSTRPVSRSLFPRKLDFGECWLKIENVVKKVMTAQPCTTKQWDDCFFDIYTLCTSSTPNRVQLYAFLVKFFIEFVDDVRAKLGSMQAIDLVESYANCWKTYNAGVNHIHELCGYLNKLAKRDSDSRLFSRDFPDLAKHFDGNSYPISALSRVIWQKFLLDPLRDRIYLVIWNEFVNARKNGYSFMPPISVRHSLESFIDVCFASDKERATLMHSVDSGTYPTTRTPSPEILKFYEQFFESRFLEDTEIFFKNSPVVEDQTQAMYDKMAQSSAILESEARLCENLLFSPTVEKTLKLLRVLFVLGPMNQFVNVLPNYVREEKKIELNLAFKLLSPFKEEGLNFLVQEYENHVAKTLLDKLNPATLTPDSFVSIICQKHYYFIKFANEVFDGSKEMNDGYRRAVETVVNEANDREPFFAAKMIARYMDLLLKKSARNRGVDDFEDKMDDAVTVFRFIKDKDTFLKIYQRLFSTRLLSKLYNSMQMESQMIEKLKNACGNDYTNKLVRMYTDVENSKQLSEEFFETRKCQCEHRENEITVIQTCAWPVISSKEDQNLVTFKIPTELGSFSKCFKDYYEAKHNGRILNYAYHVSTADVLVNIGTRASTVAMTVPQTVMLLSFLNQDRFKISELVEDSGLTFEYVCSCLKALIEFKLLKAQVTNREFYTPETEVDLNLEFSAPRSRVHLPPPAILVNRAQDPSTIVPSQQETAADRKAVVECIIVRAMKTRKTLKHNELVEFIISVTQNRFVPPITLIKSCVESLIDKHFIQRTEIDIYEYLA